MAKAVRGGRDMLALAEHAALGLSILLLVVLAAAFTLTYLDKQKAEDALLRTSGTLNSTLEDLSSAQSRLSASQAESAQKSQAIAQKEDEIAGLEDDLAAKEAEAEGLEAELSEAREELEDTKDVLKNAKEDIEAIKDETQAMEEEIAQSISWFTENAELPSVTKADRLVSFIEKGCMDEKRLNLACIAYLMEDEADIVYRSDPGQDRLYSIKEILDRKGGDCEDISLFFKATLSELERQDIELEAWTAGSGNYEVYLDKDTSTRWLIEGARGVDVGRMDEKEPYVACYFYGSDGYTKLGHCVIMLTNVSIEGPMDLTTGNLADATFIEPQSGQYMGRMGSEYLSCEDGQDGCEDISYSIAFIITDEDLYQFGDGRWNHYAGYKERIEELASELDRIRFD